MMRAIRVVMYIWLVKVLNEFRQVPSGTDKLSTSILISYGYFQLFWTCHGLSYSYVL